MMTLCPALQEKFSGENAFDQVFAAEGKIYRNFKGRKTLRFEYEGKGYFLKIHPGVGWGEIIKSLLSLKTRSWVLRTNVMLSLLSNGSVSRP